MKLQYKFLDSALDLWPPGHFELRFFASRIVRPLASLTSSKPRNG